MTKYNSFIIFCNELWDAYCTLQRYIRFIAVITCSFSALYVFWSGWSLEEKCTLKYECWMCCYTVWLMRVISFGMEMWHGITREAQREVRYHCTKMSRRKWQRIRWIKRIFFFYYYTIPSEQQTTMKAIHLSKNKWGCFEFIQHAFHGSDTYYYGSCKCTAET